MREEIFFQCATLIIFPHKGRAKNILLLIPRHFARFRKKKGSRKAVFALRTDGLLSNGVSLPPLTPL